MAGEYWSGDEGSDPSSPVQYFMGAESQHVPAMELWSYTSGTANLTEDHFEHLLFCVECQSLVDQFIEALDRLPPPAPSQVA